MSTSPSWFDQEKFSRLVKKVGPKPVSEAVPGQPGAEPENRPLPADGHGLASTARISLVSKPPSLLSEHRALPALPRRTSPLPTLKKLFPNTALSRTSPLPGKSSTQTIAAATETFPASEDVKEESSDIPIGDAQPDGYTDASFGQEGEELAAVWQKMNRLNEELARIVKERDEAVKEGALLREQLRRAQETAKEQGGSSTQAKELSQLIEERDQARHEYSELRQQFEAFKHDLPTKEESGKFRKELEQQLEGFRQKLEERNREVAALKANSGVVSLGGEGDEKLKQEVISLREQLTRAKEEASIAQRGLALSQKALYETRDTLREATEGTSLSRHNFDNLKNECAILSQQNTTLQAQNDQLSRELAATKSKMTTRL